MSLFIAGLFFGACLGMLVMALMAMAKDDKEL